MSWIDRIPIYKQIEAHRKRPLLVYVTSKREGSSSSMATDALPHIIEQLDRLPEKSRAIDFMIVSLGGDPMVAWRLMSLIRQRVKWVSVLIPQSAYSAATLLAFGANEIVMHPNGHLGPVDMQITTQGNSGKWRQFSTEDITAFLEFVRGHLKITAQDQVRILFERTCEEVGSLGIGFVARSSKLAIDLGERLLALHLKDDGSGKKLRDMVENMSKRFQSHAYPVNRSEALEMGLPVKKVRDKVLEKLMWSLWINLEEELKENLPFEPIIELMASSEAAKLLAPVPQLNIPISASASANFSTTLQDVKTAQSPDVEAVPFECLLAVVESSSLSNKCMTKGKILSCRSPDMSINYNIVTTFRGWEKQLQ
jgi:hypothetical protein